MSHSGGAHERMLRWFHSRTWTIQDITREWCGNSIVQHEPFSWSLRENAVMILYSSMSYSGGVHVRIMWWIHSATLSIQREFTWECCDDSIVQYGLLERSSCENATAIKSSKMSHPGRVQDRILHSPYEPFFQEEFRWKCFEDSVFQHWIFKKSSSENELMILKSNMTYSERIYVRMQWWFHSPTWAFQEGVAWAFSDE